MAGLRDTTARLVSVRRSMKQPVLSMDEQGSLEETRSFGANPGKLRMLSYLPEGLAAQAPLVVVLHGCTQTAEAHAGQGGWLSLAEKHGFAVLAPEQTTANNPNRCFNWFSPQDTARGQGEAASIRQMVAFLVSKHGLDPARVFVTGLSAGGAMTSAMLAAYPEVFAGGGIVAGLPVGAADNMQEALMAMYQAPAHGSAELGERVRAAGPAVARYPRVIVWHGDADSTVNPRNGAEVARQWAAVHGLAETGDIDALAKRTRTRWRSADAVLVELNVVHGMGHGTPLSTRGTYAAGSPGPYMLEAGISAASEMLRFWSIDEAGVIDTSAELREIVAPRPAAPADVPTPPASVGSNIMASLARVPTNVQQVIEKSLKDAGLM